MNAQKLTTAKIIGLTVAVMLTIATDSAQAQTAESVADAPRVVISQVQDADLLERRIQKLELQYRQRKSDEEKAKRAQQFEGSWDVTVIPVLPPGVPQPPAIHARATISRGAIISSDRSRPNSKQHGTCEYSGSDELTCTSIEDLFDAAGAFVGTLKLRVRSALIGEDDFVGLSNAEQRDAAGNLLSNRCATIRGHRITLEPLLPQCLIVPAQ
jgi:hypothetical protein